MDKPFDQLTREELTTYIVEGFNELEGLTLKETDRATHLISQLSTVGLVKEAEWVFELLNDK